MRTKHDRAAEYRRLATAAEALADASTLDHVREKHLQAAATWTSLALMDERPSLRPAAPPAARVLEPAA